MRQSQILQLGRDDAPRAVSVQIAAFVSDPIMRWMWPEAHDYVTHFPRLVHGFGVRAFENDAADATVVPTAVGSPER